MAHRITNGGEYKACGVGAYRTEQGSVGLWFLQVRGWEWRLAFGAARDVARAVERGIWERKE